MQSERVTGPGAHGFSKAWGWGALARLVNSNQKGRVLSCSKGAYVRGSQDEGPDTQEVVEDVTSGLTCACEAVGSYLWRALARGG